MKLILPAIILPIILLAPMLAGCGSKAEVMNVNERSAGQQLSDLNAARRDGIVSDKEYEKMRRAIVKKND